MSFAEIIKTYGEGKGEKAMVAINNLISDYLRKALPEEDYRCLCKKVFGVLSDGHYDKDFADAQIANMYYADKDGEHFAPYWTEGEARELYNANKAKIKQGYNFFDFEVALNMVKSDYYGIMDKWFPDSKDNEQRYVDLALNWLNDDDNPYGDQKVWGYFNGR